ncbi:unnamed protein product, partial [Penicillium manginii]
RYQKKRPTPRLRTTARSAPSLESTTKPLRAASTNCESTLKIWRKLVTRTRKRSRNIATPSRRPSRASRPMILNSRKMILARMS